MKNIFVIGNGESRRGFDLNILKQHGITIGCNALYRDFAPEILVAVDRPIISEICASGYADSNRVYVRHRWYDEFKQHTGINQLPAFYTISNKEQQGHPHTGWSSGPSAMGLATNFYDDNDLPCRIFIIGFDLTGLGDKINNIYKGTQHYLPADKAATFYGNWARQMEIVVSNRPNIQFIRMGINQVVPDIWSHLQNLEHDELTNLEKYLK